MPQANLYLSELTDKLRTAMAARGTAVQIWNHHWLRVTGGGVIQILKDGFQIMGRMQVSENGNAVFFTQLLTTPGYEKQGIGSLVVTLGILYAVVQGKTRVRLGEPDTDREKGGHFWTNLGLSEAYCTVQAALRKMLEGQALTAAKLGVTIDPNAVLVSVNPATLGTGSANASGSGTVTRTRSSSH